MENACCEFDFEKLTPTYKLLIGVPGRSNAFLISKKLGLSDKILGDASTYVSEEAVKFEDILTNIEKDKKTIKEQKELSDKMLYEAQNIKETAQKTHEEILQKKASILSKAKIEARDILINAEEEANQIIKDLIEIKTTSSKDQYKKAEENRQKIKKSISEIQKDLLSPKKENSLSSFKSNEILKGMVVYVPTIDQNVTVVSLPDKNKNIVVQSGLMKLTMHISNIEKPKQNSSSKKTLEKNKISIKKSQNISAEINLLGKTVDEAIAMLEKYIDDAYLSGLHEIRIVHGKGTGLLRKGVQAYLKSNPHIKEFRLGVYGEGDTGVTIATLK